MWGSAFLSTINALYRPLHLAWKVGTFQGDNHHVLSGWEPGNADQVVYVFACSHYISNLSKFLDTETKEWRNYNSKCFWLSLRLKTWPTKFQACWQTIWFLRCGGPPIFKLFKFAFPTHMLASGHCNNRKTTLLHLEFSDLRVLVKQKRKWRPCIRNVYRTLIQCSYYDHNLKVAN